MNDLLEQTYVFVDGSPRWLVSTLNRESSSPYANGMRYAETMVFALEDGFDADGRQMRRIVGQAEAGHGSLAGHDIMVRRLRETGSPDDPEEAE